MPQAWELSSTTLLVVTKVFTVSQALHCTPRKQMLVCRLSAKRLFKTLVSGTWPLLFLAHQAPNTCKAQQITGTLARGIRILFQCDLIKLMYQCDRSECTRTTTRISHSSLCGAKPRLLIRNSSDTTSTRVNRMTNAHRFLRFSRSWSA